MYKKFLVLSPFGHVSRLSLPFVKKLLELNYEVHLLSKCMTSLHKKTIKELKRKYHSKFFPSRFPHDVGFKRDRKRLKTRPADYTHYISFGIGTTKTERFFLKNKISPSTKTFTIQHGYKQCAINTPGVGPEQEYITSTDYVLTWVKESDYLYPLRKSKNTKYIPIGVPDLLSSDSANNNNNIMVYVTKQFLDKKIPRKKLNIDYTSEWKEKILDMFVEKSKFQDVYFVDHPKTTPTTSYHEKIVFAMENYNLHVINNNYFEINNINREDIFLTGKENYVIYPSSCTVELTVYSKEFTVLKDPNTILKVDENINNSIVKFEVTDQIIDFIINI